MRYCEKCEMLSVEPEAETCAACGEVLTSIDEIPEAERDRPVVLTTCETSYEAKVLRAALAGEGVEAIVEDEGLLETVNPFHVRAGGDAGTTRVLVHLQDAETALAFLRQKESGELALDEEDLPEADAPTDADETAG